MENTEHHGSSRRTPRAVLLLRRLVELGWFGPDAVARALVVNGTTLDAYLRETEPIPLDRQLCLALFVIECVPPLARLGHQLRGQVGAAIAFQDRATTTHSQPPPSHHL